MENTYLYFQQHNFNMKIMLFYFNNKNIQFIFK